MYGDEDDENIIEEDEDEEIEDFSSKLQFRTTELLPNTEQALLKKQKILEAQKKQAQELEQVIFQKVFHKFKRQNEQKSSNREPSWQGRKSCDWNSKPSKI